MIRKVYISPLNNIRFVKAGQIVPDLYNNPIYGESWFSEQIKRYEENVIYDQKVQTTDRLTIEIWANNLNEGVPSVQLYTCSGELVYETALTQTSESLPDEYNTVVSYQSADFWADVDPGRYYLYINLQFPNEQQLFYISEPISVAERWPDTLYIEYQHSTNKYGVLFEDAYKFFGFRFEGVLTDKEFLSDRVVFGDQNDNSIPIYANAFEGDVLIAGGGDGGRVPDYVLSTLNEVFTCDSILVEGVARTAAEGAAIEKGKEENYPLYTGSIELRLPDNTQPYTTVEGGITVFAIPPYPFVIMQFSINKGTFPRYSYTTPTYIPDSTALDDYIADRNAEIVTAGLVGELSIEVDELIYTIGAGENLDNATSDVLTKHFDFTSTTTGSGQDLDLHVTMSALLSVGTLAYAMINPSNNLGQAGYVQGLSTLEIISGYIAGSADDYTHMLFHNDKMTAATITGDYLTSLSGDCPVYLRSFNLINSPEIASFNIYNVLSDCRANLTVFKMTGCASLTSILGYYNAGDNLSMAALRLVDIRGNALTVSSINAIYNETYTADINQLFYVLGGEFITKSQSPIALPTSASAIARSNLINQWGWTLISA